MEAARLALGAVVVLVACKSPAPPRADPDRVEIADIVENVAFLRQLPHVRDIVVNLVPEAVFGIAITSEMVVDPTQREREAAWLTAFSFAPADVDLDVDVAQQTASIGAVYEPITKRIVAPRGKTFARAHVAHEIAHALADEAFGLHRRHASDDERAAWHALVEGDAAAAEWMYRGRDRLAGPAAVLSWMAHRYDLSTHALIADGGLYSNLANWSPPYRDEVLFRYVYATRFVAALHWTGGFPLVNRAWREPPSTTEQILHPEKYIAGERAIPVAAPKAPAGHRSILTGDAGELGVRSVLSLCVDDDQVVAASRGWGGDAFRVTEADGKLSLLWATTWDDEASAKRFEQTLSNSRACWDAAIARDGTSKRPPLAGPTRIERRGAAVVVARGAADADAIETAFAGIGKAPAAQPPLGPITLRPFLAEDPMPPRGVFAGRTYDLAAFGLRVAVPEEVTASHLGLGSGMIAVGPGEHLKAQIAVLPPSQAEAYATEYLEMVADSWKPRASITDAGRSDVAIPLGAADERRYLIGPITLRVYLVPICRGFRTVVIGAWWAGELNAPIFDALLQNVTNVSEELPPACR